MNGVLNAKTKPWFVAKIVCAEQAPRGISELVIAEVLEVADRLGMLVIPEEPQPPLFENERAKQRFRDCLRAVGVRTFV